MKRAKEDIESNGNAARAAEGQNHTTTPDGIEGESADGQAVSGDQEAGRRRSPVSEFLISILSGNILSRAEVRRAYPYMIFLACLAFFYIANVFRTQYLYREHSRLTEQVKELRSRSMTIASQKMIATRQSNIIIELEKRNIPLRESLKPNKVIPR